ncbi:hypothetical protein QQ045_002268 [Rhodiola kirilowii]
MLCFRLPPPISIPGSVPGFGSSIQTKDRSAVAAPQPPPEAMITLCWNYRGLVQLRLVQSLSKMVRSHKPCMVALIETKVDYRRLEEIRRRLGFAKSFAVERVGLARGLAIWWKEEVSLSVLSYSRHHIDSMVGEGVEYRPTVFYDNPISNRRAGSWELLRTFSRQRAGLWLVLGDFNEILFGWESKGRRLRREWQMRSFREAIEDCGISDLVSDHYPLLVDFHKKRMREDGTEGDLIGKLRGCRVKLANWNKRTFGRTDERVSMLKAKLESVKNQFRTQEVIEKEARISKELEESLAREELFWR